MLPSTLTPTERHVLNAVAWTHSREAAAPRPGRSGCSLRVTAWLLAFLDLVNSCCEPLIVVKDQEAVVALIIHW
jgi:hypothetical protein